MRGLWISFVTISLILLPLAEALAAMARPAGADN
jgi:hypothetical protein